MTDEPPGAERARAGGCATVRRRRRPRRRRLLPNLGCPPEALRPSPPTAVIGSVAVTATERASMSTTPPPLPPAAVDPSPLPPPRRRRLRAPRRVCGRTVAVTSWETCRRRSSHRAALPVLRRRRRILFRPIRRGNPGSTRPSHCARARPAESSLRPSGSGPDPSLPLLLMCEPFFSVRVPETKRRNPFVFKSPLRGSVRLP